MTIEVWQLKFEMRSSFRNALKKLCKAQCSTKKTLYVRVFVVKQKKRFIFIETWKRRLIACACWLLLCVINYAEWFRGNVCFFIWIILPILTYKKNLSCWTQYPNERNNQKKIKQQIHVQYFIQSMFHINTVSK